MKSREQITAETVGAPKNARQFRPAPGYVPHAKLAEWDASVDAGLLERCEPRNDRMLVQLIDEVSMSVIVLTDAKPLIGGCRKARVLKVGPGKWIQGEWWKVSAQSNAGVERGNIDLLKVWQWFPGYRRPVAVAPSQVVLIGNWTDLEANGLALCQEGDVRAVVNA